MAEGEILRSSACESDGEKRAQAYIATMSKASVLERYCSTIFERLHGDCHRRLCGPGPSRGARGAASRLD